MKFGAEGVNFFLISMKTIVWLVAPGSSETARRFGGTYHRPSSEWKGEPSKKLVEACGNLSGVTTQRPSDPIQGAEGNVWARDRGREELHNLYSSHSVKGIIDRRDM
jgi:hypothetical protein